MALKFSNVSPVRFDKSQGLNLRRGALFWLADPVVTFWPKKRDKGLSGRLSFFKALQRHFFGVFRGILKTVIFGTGTPNKLTDF